MSTPVNSTHQQDRAAQQKLVHARQQATAQGAQQSGGFSRLLSLACDEDTNLDALQLGGKLFGLKTQEPSTEADNAGPSRRKTGKGPAGATDRDTDGEVPVDGMHPAAQANATLLALLARAQAESAPPQTPAAPPEESEASVSNGANPLTATDGTIDTGPVTTKANVTDGPAGDMTPTVPVQAEPDNKPAPGKAVRDLARQLGAAMRNAAPGQDNTTQTQPQASTAGVAWGRQPVADASLMATTGASGAASPLAAQDALPPTGPAHMAVSPQVTTEPDNSSAGTDDGAASPALTNRTETRAAGGESPSQNPMGGDALGGTELSDTPRGAENTANQAEQWREQWAEAMDQMGQQVSYWVQQGGVRQATLRVGHGWQQAMDVKLSMKNGQAEIEFLTDHEAARSAIAQGGAEVLRELLAQSGIDLGQVSVGAQNAGQGNGTPAQPFPQTGQTHATVDTTEGLPSGLQPRHNQSAGLDLYV